MPPLSKETNRKSVKKFYDANKDEILKNKVIKRILSGKVPQKRSLDKFEITNDMVNEMRKSRGRRNNIFNENHKLYNGIQHIEISELTPLQAKAGDFIIFDTNCIHAGGDKFEDDKFRKVIRLHLVLNN